MKSDSDSRVAGMENPRDHFSGLTGSLLKERSNAVSAAVAFAIGLCYAVVLLGVPVAFGSSPFWDRPVGMMGGPLDIRDTVAGYWWFVQDAWRWPLLSVPSPNWPAGANAGLFDIAPIVAIAAKVVRSVFGLSFNPYPAWITACFALNAVALTALVRSLGNRSLIAAIVAGGIGAMAPVVQFRFGHTALLAHWIPTFALALYFYSKKRPLGAGVLAGFFALTVLAATTHPYLYVMTAAVCTGGALQGVLDRRLSPALGIAALMVFVLGGVIPLWALGMLTAGDGTQAAFGFGVYSMNVMSLFWPQTSGLFQWTGVYYLTRGSIGGTVGQYDGYAYLGGGVLVLLAIYLWRARRELLPAMRGNIGLVAVLTVLFIWALSNQIYIGPYRVLHYPVPHFLEANLLSVFRSSGRFVWPIAWLLAGLAVAGALSTVPRRWVVAVGALALLLQWIDTAPWRTKYATLLTPAVSVFGSAENAARVAEKIRTAGAVAVMPPVFCSSADADYSSPLNAAALEVQIAAARANARMPIVYLARQTIDCKKTLDQRPAVFVFLKDSAGTTQQIPQTGKCEDFPNASVCIVGRE